MPWLPLLAAPLSIPLPVSTGWIQVAAVGVALLVVAALVNWLAPKRRGRLRSTVILFGLLVASHAALLIFDEGGFANMALADGYFGDMVEIFAIINPPPIVRFDVALTRVGWEVSNIATDLLIGLAYLVALIAGLRHAEVNLSGLIATSAVASGVIGLALAPTIGNILGGVAIQLDGSVGVGDWIQVDANNQGKVREIRWRHTVIETRDWDTLIVPNATLLSTTVLILGKREGQPLQHRMWVYFNVDFRFPPAQVIEAVNEALQASPILNVAADPKPHAICFDLARDNRDSFAYYAVRCWLTNLAVDDPTSSLVRERIYAALQRAGIPLALPGSAVFLSQGRRGAQGAQTGPGARAPGGDALQAGISSPPTPGKSWTTWWIGFCFAPFAKGEVYDSRRARAPALALTSWRRGRGDSRERPRPGETSW